MTCLAGLHEVGRELENPFRNVPNELPVCTMMALYNEALVTMFSGFNPDAFWDAKMHEGALEDVALGKTLHTMAQGERSDGRGNTREEEDDNVGCAAIETILECQENNDADMERKSSSKSGTKAGDRM